SQAMKTQIAWIIKRKFNQGYQQQRSNNTRATGTFHFIFYNQVKQTFPFFLEVVELIFVRFGSTKEYFHVENPDVILDNMVFHLP
ncbi:hypothetical protein PJI17_31880, partial [Mycobacterium kansasii]